MSKASADSSLKEAFEMHLKETEGHVQRLTQIFEGLDEKPTGKVCKAMQGLVEEGSEMIEEDAEPAIKDAGLMAAAQRVEHYEMAGYGSVRALAELLGEKDAVDLLQQTLDEEGAADEKLNKIALSTVNPNAQKAGAASAR